MQYQLKTFEALTNIELYKLLKLRQEIFIIEQACIYPDMDNKDENAHHLLAFDGDKLLGCLRILDKGVSFAEISIGRIVVSKSDRGRGIAKEMMQRALTFIKHELGETHIKISAQTVAVPFYEGLDFQIVSTEYLDDGILHVDMLCDLAKRGEIAP